MDLLIKCCPDKFTLCLAANVLAQIAVLAALAWLLASAVARHRPALRHGIWLSALLCILLSPAVSYVAAPAGLSLISLPLLPRPASTAVELPPPPPPVHSVEPPPPTAGNMIAPRSPAMRPDFEPVRPVQDGVSPPDQEAAPAARTARTTPPPAAGDKLRAVLGLVVLLWTAGTLFFLVRLLRGWSRVVRLQRWAPAASDPRLEAVLAEVRGDLNVAVLPRLAILPLGSKLRGPITVGVFRPLVILHESLIETLDARGLRFVLLHEFAHAQRRDPLVGLLQRLVAAVFWPYPPVHLVNRRLAAAREEVCDNYVLRRGEAADYAETLLTIYEGLRGVRLHPSTLGLFHPCGNLEHRVAGMLNPRRNVMVRMHRVTVAGTAALFLTTVVLVAGTRLVEAQTKVPPATGTPAAADAGGKSSASPAIAEEDDETSPLDKMARNAASAPEGKRLHLVRSSHTWIGNDGEPLDYDNYDEQFYMSRGAQTVVLSPPGEGFRDFYGARTLVPGVGRMDVSNDHPASEPLANIVLPGAIDLPAYQLMWQPSLQQALNLSPQQRTALQEISAKYWPARRQIAGKELADTESAKHKELVEASARAHSGLVQASNFKDELPFSKELIARLERQWSETRKKIEEVLTPEQLRTLKELTFRTFAFGSGVMFEPEVLQRLGVPQNRQEQLRALERQLRKEKERRLRDVTREKIRKMLAVLTTAQQAHLRKKYGPDKNPEDDCSSFPYPNLPSQLPDTGAAEGLGFSPEQCERVRKIVNAHWISLSALQSEEQKLPLGDEKAFKEIGEKRQEMLALRKKIEAALTPQQWVTCQEIAFENQAVIMLRVRLHRQAFENPAVTILSGLFSDTVVLTERQQAALRAVEAEYFDKPQQIYCEMTDKVLAAFTPAQQEQLRAEVDRLGW